MFFVHSGIYGSLPATEIADEMKLDLTLKSNTQYEVTVFGINKQNFEYEYVKYRKGEPHGLSYQRKDVCSGLQ